MTWREGRFWRMVAWLIIFETVLILGGLEGFWPHSDCNPRRPSTCE